MDKVHACNVTTKGVALAEAVVYSYTFLDSISDEIYYVANCTI